MKWKRHHIGISTRIILVFSALIILFLGIMIFTEIVGIPGTSNKGKFGRSRDNTLNDMEVVSGLLSERFTTLFREHRKDVEQLSTSPYLIAAIENKTPKSNAEMRRELKAFLESYPEFTAVAMVDARGASVHGAGAFALARSIKDIQLNEAFLSRLTIPGYQETIDMYHTADKQDHIRIIRQIISLKQPEKILGLVIAESNAEATLNKLILSVITLFPRHWNILLAGKSSNHLTPFWHSSRESEDTPSNLEGFAPVRLAIAGINGSYDGPDENGRPVLAYHRQIKIDRGIAWALVLKSDRTLSLQPARADLLQEFILWGCMLIAGIALCIILARRITGPIRELAGVARRIEEGDLTARAEIADRSEAGELASVFNGMVEQLTTWHQDLENQVAQRTRELQVLSARQEAILTAVPDIIMETDPRDIYTWSNEAGREFFGPDVVGRKAAQYFIRNQDIFEKDQPLTEGVAYLESWHRRKDGEVRLLAWRRKALDGNSDGPSFLLTGRDITERKRAEEKLVQITERLDVALQSSKTGAWDWNLISDHVEWSSQMFELLGLDTAKDKASFDTWKNVLHPDDADAAQQRIQRALQQRNVLDSEYRIILPAGEVRWISAIGQGKYNAEGHPLRMIGICQDITERKRAGEERRLLTERLQRAEKMEALGTLAGGVAHDLNNVLGIVVGYAEMLHEDIEENSPLKKTVTTIMEAGQRSAAIVQDLLTLARRGVQTRQVVNLNTIVMDCIRTPEFEAARASHPNIRLTTELNVDLMNIAGSPTHLAKTILNLVRNAIEAMPKGGDLSIFTSNQSLESPVHGYDAVNTGDYAVLTVIDTGDGISEKDIQHIFEPFYTKKAMGRSGTGLGLAVVWGTVKDHEGYINVESRIGQGTTFTLYFPVTREDVAQPQTSVPLADYIGNDESILVVDDIKEQRELAARMLGKLNYKVRTATSGEEAVEYLKSNKADLVILDMIMEPGMDGLDTYKAILDIHPKQKAIIVSGFSETLRVKDAQALGAGEYLRKPYIMEKLGLAVRRELVRKANAP